MRNLSIVVFCGVLGLIGLAFESITSQWLVPLFLFTTCGILILLAKAYTLSFEIQSTRYEQDVWPLRAYIILHLLPIAYLAYQLLHSSYTLHQIIWLAPFIIFFFMGRRSWSALFRRYQSKLYYLFIKGNTGMLVMSTTLCFLSLLAGWLDEPLHWQFASPALSFQIMIHFVAPTRFIERLLGFYFAIHFLLIGVAIMQINQDIVMSK